MLENIFSNDPLNLPLGILKMRFKTKSKPSTVTQACDPSTQDTKAGGLTVQSSKTSMGKILPQKTEKKSRHMLLHQYILQVLLKPLFQRAVSLFHSGQTHLLRFSCPCVAGISLNSQHYAKARKAATRLDAVLHHNARQ